MAAFFLPAPQFAGKGRERSNNNNSKINSYVRLSSAMKMAKNKPKHAF